MSFQTGLAAKLKNDCWYQISQIMKVWPYMLSGSVITYILSGALNAPNHNRHLPWKRVKTFYEKYYPGITEEDYEWARSVHQYDDEDYLDRTLRNLMRNGMLTKMIEES